MKISTLSAILFVTVSAAFAKGPVQISGVMESASSSPDGVTFVITGKLDIMDSHLEGGTWTVGRATLRLFHSKVVVRKYAILSADGQKWSNQDRSAFAALASASVTGHDVVRGGMTGLSVSFGVHGNPTDVVADSASLIDSTVIDKPANKAPDRAARNATSPAGQEPRH